MNIIPIRGDGNGENIIKYEFNVTWNNAIYFKMNIFNYLEEGYNLIGIEFLYGNKNKTLFENLQFNNKLIFTEIKSINNLDSKDRKTIINIVNNNQLNGIILQCLDRNCVFQLLRNKEIISQTHYYFMISIKSNPIYFHNYINFILNRSFHKILEKSINKPKIRRRRK